MTSSISTIRQAITAEIKVLTAELNKLQKVLAQLGEDDSPVAGRGGKRKYTRRQKTSEGDVETAIGLIEKAGKGGIKAIKLAYELKNLGGSKVAKNDLLATEKVKMTGKGGGSTYVYVG
ncbi:MAG: hypothetical protein QM754_19060 [Tepidisphaeraceae bacterium]